ncbi:NAD-binding protein [Sphingomonas olei]
MTDHVVLAGCGPVGRLVATALEDCGVRYVAIERDPDRLRQAQAQGHNVVFGDATRRGILRAAGADRATAVVALLNSRQRLEHLIHEVRSLDAGLPVIVSTRDASALEPLVRAGATHVFPENLAAGLALATQTLITLGVPARDAVERIRALRVELNPELAGLPLTNTK